MEVKFQINVMSENLQSVLRDFFEGAGVPVPEADAAGVRCFTVNGVTLKLVTNAETPADVDLEAQVGSFAGVADKVTFLEDALKANFFWQGTRGGTLGLGGEGEGENLVLSDRRDADDLCAEGAFAAWLDGFVRTVRDWRQYISDLTPTAGEGVQA